MRIHHLSCICACPLGGRLMDGRSGSIFQRGSLCCHCLLVETESGMCLIDTGYGLRDVQQPAARLSGFFLKLMSPDFREEMTAVRQIERLGFEASEVRHILLTHLDFDHAGGLDDFPKATVHLMAQERDDALAQRTWLDRQRYRPAQWSSRARWRVHASRQGEPWHGFDCVRDLPGLPPEILMVPLRGHTTGHAGIAVKTATDWVFMAGDAYFHHLEMRWEAPYCTPGLRMYQTLMEKDRSARLRNQQRLRELARDQAGRVTVLCAHDNTEFEALAGRPIGAPVPQS
jgi:glyoxylase-like metal-dependent hydrolase (beta-lactamase superfamily II)